MKMLTFCFVIIFLSTFTSVAASKSVISLNDLDHLDGFHYAQIFFLNEDDNLLFIDFEVIEEKLTKVNVFKGDKIVMEEDVAELPKDMIYELDLTLFNKGEYTVELVTTNQIKIRKEVAIN